MNADEVVLPAAYVAHRRERCAAQQIERDDACGFRIEDVCDRAADQLVAIVRIEQARSRFGRG